MAKSHFTVCASSSSLFLSLSLSLSHTHTHPHTHTFLTPFSKRSLSLALPQCDLPLAFKIAWPFLSYMHTWGGYCFCLYVGICTPYTENSSLSDITILLQQLVPLSLYCILSLFSRLLAYQYHNFCFVKLFMPCLVFWSLRWLNSFARQSVTFCCFT